MASRHARNQGSNWIRKDKRLAIYLRDRGLCLYCSGICPDPDRGTAGQATLEHLVRRDDGGKNEKENLCLAHKACNSAREARDGASLLPHERIEASIRVARPIDREVAKALLRASGGNVQNALKAWHAGNREALAKAIGADTLTGLPVVEARCSSCETVTAHYHAGLRLACRECSTVVSANPETLLMLADAIGQGG